MIAQSDKRRFVRSALAAILILQLAATTSFRAQMAPERPDQPQSARPDMTQPRGASSHPATPLSSDEKILHVLNRFTYGPRPGDLERVRAIGLNAWFKEQFNPQSINDSALDARLESYPAMRLPLDKLMEDYPTQGMIRATMNGRAGIPRGEAEKAIYNDQMARQKAKKDGKDQGQLNEFAPLPEEQVQSILDLPPDKRFSALCKMKPAQLRDFRQSLSADERQHLTEGFTPQQIEELAAFNSPQAVVAAEDEQTKLLREIYSERQLNEVMADFWLNHFNVYIRKSQQAPYYIASYERDVIRPRALGSFENLLVAVASSPAMLTYLDNASSIGPHSFFATRPTRAFEPNNKRSIGLNENYARELMELHTVGVNGGYTQRDVTEVAKVFTGWTVGRRHPLGGDDAQAEYDPTKHEPGPKQVLGTTIKDNGEKEGLQVLHMLATSPKTARFISTKLAVRFVSDDPPPAMIDRMAKTFLSTNGDIRRVLLAMINSPEFFSRENYRAKLKTPHDFVVSAVRASGANIDSPGALVQVVADLGMPIYGMQTPNGYSMKADAWNNTAALVERMNFALALASNRVAGVSTDWGVILGSGDASLSAEAKTAMLEDKLLHVSTSDRTKQTILTQVSADPQEREASLRQVAAKDRRRDPLAVSGPRRPSELMGMDTESALAAGLLFGSPEFQRR